MSFLDSYKHLEKLCGEILNDNRKISAYIDEMVKTPNGSVYVNNWDIDLKTLKHYRWIRNQISHEPGCSEENMCSLEDEIWLNTFYTRIINQTDPLSLYRKSCLTTNKIQSKVQTESNLKSKEYNSVHRKKQRSTHVSWLILFLILILLFLLCKQFYIF